MVASPPGFTCLLSLSSPFVCLRACSWPALSDRCLPPPPLSLSCRACSVRHAPHASAHWKLDETCLPPAAEAVVRQINDLGPVDFPVKFLDTEPAAGGTTPPHNKRQRR